MAPMRLENAQPGMELAADVTDRNGQLLARAGKEISEKELRLFKMWGVIEIEIAGGEGDDGAGATMDAEVLPEHEEAAKEFFRHTDLEHELMVQLFRECARRLAREGGSRA